MPRSSGRFPTAGAKPTFVLDVSVALPWIIRRLWTDYTDRVVNTLVRSTALIPATWLTDLASSVLEAERQGWIQSADVSANLAILDGYPFRVDGQTTTYAWDAILAYAREFALGIPQATALELASRSRLPLATIDTRLLAAAPRAGVPIFTP